MNHTFVLGSRTHKEEKNKQTWTYKYKPTGKKVTIGLEITAKTDDPFLLQEQTGLPESIGDTFELEIRKVNKQSNLDKEEKKEK